MRCSLFYRNGLFLLIFKSCVVDNGILSGGFYILNVNEPVSFHTESHNSLSSYALCHRKLDHISLDKMKD